MRDFFIQALDKVISAIVIIGGIAVVIGFFVVLFAGPQGGLLPALAILFGGSLYLIIVGGLMYLFLGIYANTKRTAELLERNAVEPRL